MRPGATVVRPGPVLLAALFLGNDTSSPRPSTVTWSRRAFTSCDGTRYRIVLSSDLYAIQCCSVRTSKPLRSVCDANVDRNVFKSNLAGSSPARFATAFQRSSMWYSRFPFGEEYTKLQPEQRACALSRSINWTGSAPPALPDAWGRSRVRASRPHAPAIANFEPVLACHDFDKAPAVSRSGSSAAIDHRGRQFREMLPSTGLGRMPWEQ